jgi:hypothetical protein
MRGPEFNTSATKKKKRKRNYEVLGKKKKTKQLRCGIYVCFWVN